MTQISSNFTFFSMTLGKMKMTITIMKYSDNMSKQVKRVRRVFKILLYLG